MTPHSSSRASVGLLKSLAFLLVFTSLAAFADQVEMLNGDRYVGRVLTVNTNEITLQSEVLGTVKLPRSKVSRVTMGDAPAVAVAAPKPLISSNAPLPALPQTHNAAESNIVKQVQLQYLAGASPEANAKFNQLAGGLLTGKLTVDDIRVEAQSAADQLRKFKAELGEDGGEEIDSYLAILDNFLKETKPASSTTNAPASNLKPKALPLEE